MEGGDTMSGQDEARQLRRRACCLTGHRVLPSDPDERMELTHNLRKTVARLAQEGIACTSRLRSTPTGCISSARSMRVAV